METRIDPHAAGDGWVESMTSRQLFREFVEQGERLVREELRLAKEEIRDEARLASKAGILFGIGGVVGLGAFLVLCFCAVFLLSLAMPMWVGALIVGVFLALVCGGLIWTGRDRLKHFSIKPKETVETLQEDRRWAQETMHAVRSRTHANA